MAEAVDWVRVTSEIVELMEFCADKLGVLANVAISLTIERKFRVIIWYLIQKYIRK